MTKWITVATVAALLFSVGLFAGHSVPFSIVHATGSSEQSRSGVAFDSGSSSNDSAESLKPDVSEPISFISHAAAIVNTEVRTVAMIEHSADSDEHRTAIRKLIEQHFPDMDSSVAEIWVQTYAEMDIDEIDFVLEQKRRTSNANGMQDLNRSLSDSLTTAPFSAKPEPSVILAIRNVQTNLQSAFSLGFRRMVVLPEAIGDLDSITVNERLEIPVTRFRSFEPGTLIQSPAPTHVALTKSNTAMFRLEGDRLTRRGDFSLLKDRRLGIVTRSGEFASAESTPLPGDAIDVQVAQDGAIQFRNAAGDTCQAGRIAVCSVNDLSSLLSDDGVFFTAASPDDVNVQVDTSAVLLTKSLEQSNVERSYENSLLTYLKSLSHSSY